MSGSMTPAPSSGTTYTFDQTGTIETFVVTTSGTYDINADGGRGGADAQGGTGGFGADVSGDVYLTAGETLDIVVGGAGAAGTGSGGGGGGGGSFVYVQGGALLDVAGGGGGAYASFSGSNGSLTHTGTPGGTIAGGAGGTNGGNGSAPRSGSPGYGFIYQSQFGFDGGSGTRLPHGVGGAGGYGGGGGAAVGGGGGGGFSGGGSGGVGGGGGSYFTHGGSHASYSVGTDPGTGFVTIEMVCYLRGTRILTPTGEVSVEDLAIGDRVVTRFGAIRPIRWIGRQSFDGRAVQNDRDTLPVCIRAGALAEGLPARDLYVSPGHSMLIDDTLVLASSLVNGITITQDWAPARIEYYNLDLGTHDCVIAEGTWSESFADGPTLRDRFHNLAEFEALYPDHRPPEELILCAPRPMRGAKLDAVLRPIVERTMRGLRNGEVRGFIDLVRDGWTVEGWAHDPSHAEAPVILEVLLEGKVIGTVLACEYRRDLAEAGFGSGRCRFAFASPIKIRPETAATLRVRPANGGADLPMTVKCQATIEAMVAPPAAEAAQPRLRLVA